MKKNYKQIKENIAKVMSDVRSHYDLSEAMFHLSAALSFIEQRENKEIRRKSNTIESSNNWILNNGKIMNPEVAKNMVNQIDKLIEFENKKLQNFTTTTNTQNDNEETTLID
jgi:hypothetical protein